MKLWKSPALYFGVLLLLAVGSALLAPYVVDWTRYRTDLERAGGELTGRSVKIGGPISVRLFPWPRLTLEDVRIANPPGARDPYLLKAKRIEARITLAGLFSGHVQVETVDIVGPLISLERMTTGQGSWRVEPSLLVLNGSLLDHVKLDRIRLSGGTIRLIDSNRNGKAVLDHVEAELSAPGIGGPWRLRGHASYKSKPLDIAVNTGTWRAGDPFKFGFRIAPLNGPGLVYEFDGRNEGKKIKGALRIEPAATPDGRGDAEGELRPLLMTAQVTSDFDTVALDKIEIAPRDTTQGTNLLTGNAGVDLGPAIKLTADLSASRFDLDSVAGARARSLLRDGGGLVLLSRLVSVLPDDVELDGSLKINSLVAGGATLDQVTLSADVGNDSIRIRELSAGMPGQSRGLFKGVFVVTDTGPQLLGDVAGETGSVRDFVLWAWPEGADGVSKVWTGGRGRLKVQTKLDAGADYLRFQDAEFQIEESLGTGALSLTFGDKPTIDLRLDTAAIDLDQFIPNGITAFAPAGQGWTSLAAALVDSAGGRDLRLTLQAGELHLNGVVANDVAVDIAANDKGIDLKTIEIGRVGDAKLSILGLLTPGKSGPAGSLSASVVAQDPRGLLQLLGFSSPGEPAPWMQALGVTNLHVGADFKPDEGGRVATLRVDGTSGALSIEGVFSAAAASDWWKSEFSGTATLSSSSADALLQLADLMPLAAPDAPAKLIVTLTGSLDAGVLADLQADALGAHVQYQGKVFHDDKGFRANGRAGIFAERTHGLFAALGLQASDGVLSLESDIDVTPARVGLPTIKGLLAGSPLSGTLMIEGGKQISGEVTTGRVRLADLLALTFLPWSGAPADLEGPFSSGLPGQVTGELWIKPARLDIFDGLSMTESQIGISADEKQIRLAAAGKSASGEKVQLEFGSRAEGDGRAVDGRVTVPVDLGKVLTVSDGSTAATGSVVLSAEFQGEGLSPAAAFAALKGSGQYGYSQAALNRIDIPRFSDIISKAKSAQDVKAALSAIVANGEAILGDGSGTIAIDDGGVEFSPISMTSPTGDVTAAPSADVANGALDLKITLKPTTVEGAPPMEISYIGAPGNMARIVDANALESYLGFKVLEQTLAEIERVQREQQRIYEEEERARKEDEARLEAYYAQRRELQLRLRELKVHRVNREIQAARAREAEARATAEAIEMNRSEMELRLHEARVRSVLQEREIARIRAEDERKLREWRTSTKAELTLKIRELRIHRRMRVASERQKIDRFGQESLQRTDASKGGQATAPINDQLGEPVRVPVPRTKSAPSDTTTATIDPFQPLVIVPPSQPPSKPPAESSLLDLLTSPGSMKKWMEQRNRNR